jgi:outer membrane protein assembly factor BamB
VRQLPPQRPAWPDQPLLQGDAVHQPVLHGTTVLLASSRSDSLVALDVATGKERWRFVADGPFRFPPAVWQDRVYGACDDGWLYCLDLHSGALAWKHRGAPSGRKVLGNERLISTWPARGAPAVAVEADGSATVYYAAGIWPFMGIFLHALDARTGAVRWSNSGDGSIYMKQPHQAEAFGGLAPQGSLVVVGDRLLIPGRSTPACYDRHTGKLLHFRLADSSKKGGGPDVQAGGAVYFNGGATFELATGDYLGDSGSPAVVVDGVLYGASGDWLRACDVRRLVRQPPSTFSLTPLKNQKLLWQPHWQPLVPLPGLTCLAQAGNRLYAGTRGQVLAFDLPLMPGLGPCWQTPLAGTPARLAIGEDHVLVSTREDRLYCFARQHTPPERHTTPVTPLPVVKDDWTARAARLLAESQARAGYAVVWGAGSGRLVEELLRQSELHLIVVEPNPARAAKLRQRLIAAEVYGARVAVLPGPAAAVELPPYLARLMVSEDLAAAGCLAEPGFVRQVFNSLRPYGGMAWLPLPPEQRRAVRSLLAEEPQQARLRERPEGIWLVREGPLPGAGDWTHEHADAANTRISPDRRVKAPLGLLWFGGPGHQGMLPRHGHGPQPQVIDGRLLLEGVDQLRALDIYTGRLLWETPLPGLGKPYDTLPHQPGANASGSNFASAADGIYVAHGSVCRRLDPATGRELAAFAVPPLPDKGNLQWAHVAVSEGYLIGGIGAQIPPRRGRPGAFSSSAYLVVLDRHSGNLLWSRAARGGFRHNAICAAGGRLYVIDRLPVEEEARLWRRGEEASLRPQLLALELSSGRQLWSSDRDIFGTWLSYSAEYDVVMEAGRQARDTLMDEPRGMRAYRAGTGKVLWLRRDCSGPAMIHGRHILREKGATDLLTGKPVERTDPLTGEQVEWTWTRTYGCNTPAGAENLLTFRSGAAGYCDIAADGGTGNFGGFRSGCTNNLVVAGGLVSAPDYTRNCTCSYQNQTSLALVPMPEAEMWTYYGPYKLRGTVERVGINLGAPGNRRAEDGTLWLEYPRIGGPSPQLPITTVPAEPEWFRRHSSTVEGTGLKWVAASGARGLRRLSVRLSDKDGPARSCWVRLYFLEPDGLPAGGRRFDVALQGKVVLPDLDVNKEAGGPNRPLVREVRRVRVRRDLVVDLTPAAGSTHKPVLCGVEVLPEEE